jgi:hypothetical protein
MKESYFSLTLIYWQIVTYLKKEKLKINLISNKNISNIAYIFSNKFAS